MSHLLNSYQNQHPDGPPPGGDSSLNTDLLFHMTLNELQGQQRAESITGQLFTNRNNPPHVAGVVGNALAGSNTNDYGVGASYRSEWQINGDFTVAAWFKPPSARGRTIFSTLGAVGDRWFQLYMWERRVRFFITYDGNSYQLMEFPIPVTWTDNAWNLVMVAWDNTNFRGHCRLKNFDGTVDNFGTDPLSNAMYQSGSPPFDINFWSSGNDPSDSDTDEVHMWDRFIDPNAGSDNEFDKLYNQHKGGFSYPYQAVND